MREFALLFSLFSSFSSALNPSFVLIYRCDAAQRVEVIKLLIALGKLLN